jgi:hypothetical protein
MTCGAPLEPWTNKGNDLAVACWARGKDPRATVKSLVAILLTLGVDYTAYVVLVYVRWRSEEARSTR